MEAIVYSRVSTQGQAVDGVSLEAQAARAAAWCQANGYSVTDRYEDAGISGSRADNRPGLQDALDAACEQGAALVVYSLSRLARSTRDALAIADRLEKAGADLVSLSEQIDTTSAAGKMVFRMLAVLNEFERDLVSERTRAALQHKRSKGQRVGQVPYGMMLSDDGVSLEPHPQEQATLHDIRTMRDAGWTWKRIATELNRRGIQTKKGREWTWQTARRLVA